MSISDVARNLIFQQLEAKGISERQCLIACGINTTFFADWKTGKTKSPTFDKIYPIFKYLGLSLDELGTAVASVPPIEMTEDETELLRIYRMLDREGKTLVLSAAYGEKRHLAESIQDSEGAAIVADADEYASQKKA